MFYVTIKIVAAIALGIFIAKGEYDACKIFDKTSREFVECSFK